MSKLPIEMIRIIEEMNGVATLLHTRKDYAMSIICSGANNLIVEQFKELDNQDHQLKELQAENAHVKGMLDRVLERVNTTVTHIFETGECCEIDTLWFSDTETLMDAVLSSVKQIVEEIKGK